METTVKQRLIKFLEYKRISKSEFEKQCGMANGYVNSINKGFGSEKLKSITLNFPDLNRDWLLYGEGEMLKPTSSYNTINQQYSNNATALIGDNYNVNMPTSPDIHHHGEAPVIPTALAQKPNFDILPFLEGNPAGVEMSSINVKYTPITMWYRMQDNSMLPNYHKGDLIALLAYPQGEEDPIPGKFYAVDTISNGIVARLLIPCDDGYIARAINNDKYPDFFIKRSNIIRIYKKVLMVRF